MSIRDLVFILNTLSANRALTIKINYFFFSNACLPQIITVSTNELLLIFFLCIFQGKKSTNDENKALKSSKSFFTQLQDNATSTNKTKSMGKKKSSTDVLQHETKAKRFKL